MLPINQLIKLRPSSLAGLMLKASICHKSRLPPKKCYRWPYERWSWSWHSWFMDPNTKKKMDENSVIIQVDGNVNAGKDDIARRLADQLGMLYMPPVDLDNYYINEHGFDYRAFNVVLPERLRNCDWEMFHENPSRHSVIHMQNFLFKMRAFQYMTALRHIFNTGQGVVMNRSVFTERALVEGMHEVGWLPMGYVRGDGLRFYDWRIRYNHQRNLILSSLLKPHLTVYVDTPVDICMERIKNDPDPLIANSNAMTREFLEAVENAYNNIVLPKQDHNGRVLRVDGSKNKLSEAEIMDIVDDIEDLDFDIDVHDTRFEDWNPRLVSGWYRVNRIRYTSTKCLDSIMPFMIDPYDIAGLGDSISQLDLINRQALYEGHITDLGFNQDVKSDVRLQGIFKALFHRLDYNHYINLWLRSDFL